MPFFLRARRAALLEPAKASAGFSDKRRASLPRLRVLDLELNHTNVRMSWWWKQERASYFEGCEWHEDETSDRARQLAEAEEAWW